MQKVKSNTLQDSSKQRHKGDYACLLKLRDGKKLRRYPSTEIIVCHISATTIKITKGKKARVMRYKLGVNLFSEKGGGELLTDHSMANQPIYLANHLSDYSASNWVRRYTSSGTKQLK